jgi:NitT/TauT family transport system substrate-binding protein
MQQIADSLKTLGLSEYAQQFAENPAPGIGISSTPHANRESPIRNAAFLRSVQEGFVSTVPTTDRCKDRTEVQGKKWQEFKREEPIMHMMQSRRRFLATLSAAGAAGLIEARNSAAAESSLETTTVRLARPPTICIAAQYVVEELLTAEGFGAVHYVPADGGVGQAKALANGEIDFSLHFAAPLIIPIDRGEMITVIAGVHVGCFQLFAREGIRSIAELKGKTVGTQGIGSSPHVFLSSMATLVGLDPVKDIRWVTSSSVKPMDLFAEGKIDAFLGFPPEPQQLRARNIGRVIVNSVVDRPWSQYFCCMLSANKDYVRKYPVATKRVLRAILKAADLCATEPARVAQQMVDRGFTPRYDYALQTLSEVSYAKWRDYDPEDTMRFYALRLREAGMIKSNPNKIVADGTDWRFLNELKRELKG